MYILYECLSSQLLLVTTFPVSIRVFPDSVKRSQRHFPGTSDGTPLEIHKVVCTGNGKLLL